MVFPKLVDCTSFSGLVLAGQSKNILFPHKVECGLSSEPLQKRQLKEKLEPDAKRKRLEVKNEFVGVKPKP